MSLYFYKCNHCGNVAIKPYDRGVKIFCCGEAMEKLEAGITDAAREKHVPQVTVNGSAVEVQVGSVAHPMTEEHQISFICLETKKGYQFVELADTDEPKASFAVAEGDAAVRVYEYCNLHGLWSAEV